MGAHSLTAVGIASALLGKRRVSQEVRIVTTAYGGGMGPRYVVFCAGNYYECGKHALKALQDGTSPEDLELELAEGMS